MAEIPVKNTRRLRRSCVHIPLRREDSRRKRKNERRWLLHDPVLDDLVESFREPYDRRMAPLSGRMDRDGRYYHFVRCD